MKLLRGYLVGDEQWSSDKNVLELDCMMPLEAMIGASLDWRAKSKEIYV